MAVVWLGLWMFGGNVVLRSRQRNAVIALLGGARGRLRLGYITCKVWRIEARQESRGRVIGGYYSNIGHWKYVL